MRRKWWRKGEDELGEGDTDMPRLIYTQMRARRCTEVHEGSTPCISYEEEVVEEGGGRDEAQTITWTD